MPVCPKASARRRKKQKLKMVGDTVVQVVAAYGVDHTKDS